ncbi:MAG: transglycosylase domain-containing protein, partial [Ramlibacter sp.]
MIPAVRRAASFSADQFGRLRSAVKRHPVRSALALPALALLYVLVLIPLTPGTGDLRRAKTEVPARVMSADGVLLAEYKRINRQWVPLNRISPHVVDALIATEDRRFY